MKRACAHNPHASDIESTAVFPEVLNWKLNRTVMPGAKRIADVGYRLFSGSMMLLTVYGGYLCVMRAQRYMQKRKQLELAEQNGSTTSESIKD
ncbi:cytochrome c oxidase assembly protein COX14 homolog [Xyrauchen texanus]|uniref:cytochrome c oxidase assembly protein COX14 homolog n=1 Tax=Xyrauchen texanus TaxID=154827 RepID=UPI002241AAE0|nr:cytochrome c oxidase assembly protein COX14 homolog [Xyrauchen texanus]